MASPSGGVALLPRMGNGSIIAKDTKNGEVTHVELPDERSIEVPPRGYQPTKVAGDEVADMPRG